MAEDSNIPWTDHTHNFWMGCNKVSQECDNCYIGPLMKRGGREPFDGPIKTKDWTNPLRWQTKAMQQDERFKVFTCSLSDYFHQGADPWRDEAWDLIRTCDRLDWQILTKRIRQANARLPQDWSEGWNNVWLGVTVGCNASLKRLDPLLDTPAKVRWVSAEPLLEKIDLTPWLDRLDWVVAGGESGPGRRQSDIEWYEDLAEQCWSFGVPFFMKQDTAQHPGRQGRIPDHLWSRKEFPHPITVA